MRVGVNGLLNHSIESYCTLAVGPFFEHFAGLAEGFVETFLFQKTQGQVFFEKWFIGVEPDGVAQLVFGNCPCPARH